MFSLIALAGEDLHLTALLCCLLILSFWSSEKKFCHVTFCLPIYCLILHDMYCSMCSFCCGVWTNKGKQTCFLDIKKGLPFWWLMGLGCWSCDHIFPRLSPAGWWLFHVSLISLHFFLSLLQFPLSNKEKSTLKILQNVIISDKDKHLSA